MHTMPAIKINSIYPALPAADMDRAKRWYERTLGLRPVRESEQGALYQWGDGRLFVFPSQGAGTNKATAATVTVDDARRTAEDLRSAGVELEKYDIPGVTWEGDVAKLPESDGEILGGWFKDSEGNILAFGEFPLR